MKKNKETEKVMATQLYSNVGKGFVFFSLLVSAFSCNKEAVPQDSKQEQVIVMSSASTKSQLSGQKILWSPFDEISVFDGNDNCRFVTQSNEYSAVFTGNVSTGDYYYALYPYDNNASINGNVISTELPSEQSVVAGTFAPGANLAVTKTAEVDGVQCGIFRNAGCYLKLNISGAGTGISNITAAAIGGEALSGPVQVQIDETGMPSATDDGGNSYARLVSSNGIFNVGSYYLVLLPNQLSRGLRITVNGSDRELLSYDIDELTGLERNVVYSFTFAEDWLSGSLEIEGLGEVIDVNATAPDITTDWNDWHSASDVRSLLLSAANSGKTYFSMFKYFNFETSDKITGYKLTTYGLPYIYGVDFYKAFGTFFPIESQLEVRSNLKSIVKKAWRTGRSIPAFSWHLESPYAVYSDFCERQGESMGCRYAYDNGKSDNFPAKYRYQVRDILNNRQIDTLGIHCLGDWFDDRVREIADFINDMVDDAGNPIPIILRLWHEVEDSWAWWQVASYSYTNCTKNEYIQLYQLTVTKLRNYCPNAEILFAFCTDRYFDSKNEYLTCYPGDGYVDILGYDDYSIGDASDYYGIKAWALSDMKKRSRNVSSAASDKGKIAALFETNNVYEGDAARNYYNDYVQEILQDSNTHLSIFQVWSTSENTTEKKEALKEFIRRDNILFEKLAPQE